MWAMQVAAAGTLLTTLVLASCGNSGSGASVDEPVSTSGPGSSTGSEATVTVRPCVVFTLEEVEAMVGVPVTAGPNPHSGTSGCKWTAEQQEEGSRSSHIVDLQVHDLSRPLDEMLTLDGQPQPVDGLGDEALVEVSSSGFPAVMAGYRDAARAVTLRYEVQSTGSTTFDPRDDPDVVVATLRDLSTKVAQTTD
jgi:hypothetical protein